MSIYAISDLHLTLSVDKPMDVFDKIWEKHPEKIKNNWDSTVTDDDTVLVCGDLSWALKFEDASEDIDFLAQRKGHKILIRGNHDYWWNREAYNRISKKMPPSITLLHGNSFEIGNIGITGTRGWRKEESIQDNYEKIAGRELLYLERGLEAIKDKEIKIVMLHFPPFDLDLRLNEFADVVKKHKTDILVYGHIHGGECIEGNVCGTIYKLVAVDHINFSPIKLL